MTVEGLKRRLLIPIVRITNYYKGLLKIRMFDFVSLFKKINYGEKAAYTCVAKTRQNAQVSKVVSFTSKLAVTFFMKP